MKLGLLILLSSSIFADIRVAEVDGGFLDTYGITKNKSFSENKTESYDLFIKRKTKCSSYDVIGFAGRLNHEKIMIDCKDYK